ncbi:hypothetical protein BV20DRAFT_696617 [Pilatotrama ljubarskyi]|nr:hypothetical protein BV20DRAFT_696617 [Pilatotrama ljubarskyi]
MHVGSTKPRSSIFLAVNVPCVIPPVRSSSNCECGLCKLPVQGLLVMWTYMDARHTVMRRVALASGSAGEEAEANEQALRALNSAPMRVPRRSSRDRWLNR